jgi:hypothetical protein
MARSALAQRGDDGRTPRHTLFFFYGGNFEELGATAVRAGYQIRPTVQRDGVVVETTIAVDDQSFLTHGQKMEAWAEEFGCDYDGWECRLVNQ